ncbi:HEAT repeat domain-containing protein [Corallococcus sp. M34]|uniref:HEAT repeat domain-containing protein n=1 Tax=Citreicoccus inhibens TaxID=2849499 RepID=UPI001C23C0D1|nr:HEAT repeat domain-containing protein [Citreicoccus inhibens]MBU8896826.1 HEAT repeat domain-containing protein [Citreicoccus inhibens]
MRTRLLITLGVAGALALLLAVGLGLFSESPAVVPDAPVRFAFPSGRAWAWRLSYDAASHVTLSGTSGAAGTSSLAGRVLLDGRLVLKGLGKQGDAWRVGLRLEDLRQHSLQVFGKEVLPDAASTDAIFQGREAVLEVGPEGDVRSVSFREQDPSLFKNTVQALVGDLQVVLRDGEAWTVEESTSRGRARTGYTRRGADDAQGAHLEKRRDVYTEVVGLGQGGPLRVDSHFLADVSRAGLLERLEGEETVERLGPTGTALAGTTVHLRLVREEGGVAPDAAPSSVVAEAQQRLPPGRMVVEAQTRENMLAQQVDGLTVEKLDSLLKSFGRGGVMPDHNHFLLQATGLLEQQPALCAHMVDVFRDPAMGSQGRALVLDLLAGAGTPEAQAALVDALRTPEAHAERYHMMLSRLSLLTEPTVETVRFAQSLYGGTDGDVHIASAYSLGATAGALYRNAHSPEALAAVQRIASDLRDAKAPVDQAHLLLSLGNAGVPETVATVMQYAHADNAEVREAAAKALRKVRGPEVESALMGLAHDAAVPVQATAFESLGRQKLQADALVQLRDLALAGQVNVQNYHGLVSLVEPYVHTEPAVRDLLEYLLTQDVPDRQIRTRIRGLLEG